MISKAGNMLKLQIVYTVVSLILERGYTCINIQNKCSCLDDSDFHHYTCIKKLVNNSDQNLNLVARVSEVVYEPLILNY